MSDTPAKSSRRVWIVLSVLVLVAGTGAAAYFLGVKLPFLAGKSPDKPKAERQTRLKVELVTGKGIPDHTLSVPEDVRVSLNIRKHGEDLVAIADPPPPLGNRPLTLVGSTMFDPATLHRVRARFVGKVTSIATKKVFHGNTYEDRELRSGDEVDANSVLAVFESIDVGMKKNDLIDALVNMKLDRQVQESADENSAIPLVQKLIFRQKVEADQNAINRAVQNLEVFELPKEDIDAVYKEADNIIKLGTVGKRDTRKDPKWARVELRAPDSGTIVERNVNKKELVQDNNQNLFQIAKVDKVVVQINAHEDELRELLALKPEDRKWTIQPYGLGPADAIDGYIEEIGLLEDAFQHTIPLRGRIENKNKALRGRQFVTATIKLPPPPNVLEVPSTAVMDDGKQAIVFVQDPKNASYFSMRRVHVAYRFDDKVFVSSMLTDQEMKLTQAEKDQGLLPKQPLTQGDRLITAGLLELKKELDDREAELSQ
jgi:cobalt-zinc-cadmium efflux system membrane fusion protein